jgi:pyruvate dehydrogenase E1 component beta subunit
MAAITLIEAVNLALAHELKRDNDVVVLGEDVGVNGGVFRATNGLQQKFGKERVIDTPLAESMIAGLAIGMAAQGMKPVAEMQFDAFMMPAYDMIYNHIGRMRSRTRGRLSMPLVIRAPWGGGIHAPEHHSDSPEAQCAHIPGMKVVIPSNPSRAYGRDPRSGSGDCLRTETRLPYRQTRNRRQRRRISDWRLFCRSRRH